MKVNVIDGICGSGKTSLIIDRLEEFSNPDAQVIFITPFLEECHRIAGTIPVDSDPDSENQSPQKDKEGNYIYSKDARLINMDFRHPEDKGFGKSADLLDLIKSHQNIVTTHALFLSVGRSIELALEKKKYILIMDEAVDVIHPFGLDIDSLNAALDLNLVSINPNNEIIWNDKSDYKNAGIFSELKKHCKNKRLIYENGTVYWLFPPTIFDKFETTIVLTYLFSGSILKYYCDAYNISTYVEFVDEFTAKYLNKDYSKLIDIHQHDKMNFSKREKNALSSNWFKTNRRKTKDFAQLKKNTSYYFSKLTNSIPEERLWTVFKDYKKFIIGPGYKQKVQYINFNMRAVNGYSDRNTLVYLCNVYMDPNLKKFFSTRNVEIDEEFFALSEFIQWIFRSSIRKGEKIQIYIPSYRMRKILEGWIQFETDKFYNDPDIRDSRDGYIVLHKNLLGFDKEFNPIYKTGSYTPHQTLEDIIREANSKM